MGIADLHIHSIHSWDGTSTVSAILKKASHHLNLNVIAITDHDEIKGALEAVLLASYYGIEVIPGIEISTKDGHLLGLFVNKKISPGLSLIETLIQIGDLGGIAIAAHPSANGMKSLNPSIINKALNHPRAGKTLLGLEVFNASLVHMHSNSLAKELANQLPIAAVGNSDAHLLWLIGKGATSFPGTTSFDLRFALENRLTKVIYGKRKSNLAMIPHWLVRKSLRRAGMVSWNSSPSQPLQFGRVVD